MSAQGRLTLCHGRQGMTQAGRDRRRRRNRSRKWLRWAKHTDFPRRTDEQGRNLCRYCGKVITASRRTAFCGPECVHEYNMRTHPGYARTRVWRRDQGKCGDCGRDTVRLSREMNTLWAHVGWEAVQEVLAEIGFDLHRVRDRVRPKNLWEMDHIIAVAEGGGRCGLDGLRTLCTPCHKERTRGQQQSAG